MFFMKTESVTSSAEGTCHGSYADVLTLAGRCAGPRRAHTNIHAKSLCATLRTMKSVIICMGEQTVEEVYMTCIQFTTAEGDFLYPVMFLQSSVI